MLAAIRWRLGDVDRQRMQCNVMLCYGIVFDDDFSLTKSDQGALLQTVAGGCSRVRCVDGPYGMAYRTIGFLES